MKQKDENTPISSINKDKEISGIKNVFLSK